MALAHRRGMERLSEQTGWLFSLTIMCVSPKDNHPAVSRVLGIGCPSYPQAAGWVYFVLNALRLKYHSSPFTLHSSLKRSNSESYQIPCSSLQSPQTNQLLIKLLNVYNSQPGLFFLLLPT